MLHAIYNHKLKLNKHEKLRGLLELSIADIINYNIMSML